MLLHSLCFSRRRALIVVLVCLWTFILFQHLEIGCSVLPWDTKRDDFSITELPIPDTDKAMQQENLPIDEDALRNEFQRIYDGTNR